MSTSWSTREELKEVAPGKSETIEISDFVELGEIDPVHFRQTYYLAPRGKGADRAYALLRQAMHETGKIGIATMMLRDKEHLVAVRPGDDVLILETMYFADEIRSPSEELETLPQDASFPGRELEVAKRLVESLTVLVGAGGLPQHLPGPGRGADRAQAGRRGGGVRGGAAQVERHRPDGGPGGIGREDGASGAGGGTGETATGQTGDGPGPGGRPATAARGPAAASGPPDLDALSKADLLARAAELDIPGRSKMPKPELIKAIQAAGRPKRGPEDFLANGRFPGNLPAPARRAATVGRW